MTWWAWLLVFALILAAGGYWIWRQARRAWRSGRALADEAARISEQAAILQEAAERPRPDPPGTTVFTGTAQVRAETRAVREALNQQRREARAARLPPWARR